MTWHADAAVLDRYARGRSSDIEAASIEAHVTHCPDCRRLAAVHVDQRELSAIKRQLDEQVDEPRTDWSMRWLSAIGIADRDARLISGSLALETSWFVACLVAMAFAALATGVVSDGRALVLFLVIAPLVPLAGVALAFGRRADPAFEIAQACPTPSIRLLLVRSLAVIGVTIPVLLALSVPFGSGRAFVWLLPALGLAAAALAAGTFVPLTHAGVGLAVLWCTITGLTLSGASRATAEAFSRDHVAYRSSGQLLCVVLAAISLAVLAARRHRYEETR